MASGTQLKIRRVPLDDLRLDPANVRTHPERNLDALKGSLSRFGQQKPIVVDRAGIVRAGNGTYQAARALAWTEIDVVETDLEGIEAVAYAIADNRTSDLSEFDDDALAKLLIELRVEESLEGVGFTDAEIDELVADLEADLPAKELQDPGPEAPPEEPVTCAGDLWTLGDHRILCGDSTRTEDLHRLMAGKKAALLATDPPYLVDYRGGNHPQSFANRPETRDKHWDDYVDPVHSVAFFEGFLAAALAHCVERVPVYQWHAHRRQALVEEAWKAAGLLVHQQIIWVKARPVLTRSHYMWRHEPCFYGWRKGMMPPKHARPAPNLSTVWEIDQVGQQDGIHPTQKPTRVFEIPIEEHTRRGAVVLEPFSGSGTQIIAAEKLGRRCYAAELAPAYVDVAVRRWEKATGRQATLEGTEQTFEQIAGDRIGQPVGEEEPDG